MKRIERSSHLDQRILESQASDRSYEMEQQQKFRMPVPLYAAVPRFPAETLADTLPPTTICVRIVVTAQGAVERADVLDNRVECHAGAAQENSGLIQAVREQLLKWTFVPAAICTWTAGPPPAADDCPGAWQVQPVPVSLLYAFTFEIRERKATVRSTATQGR